MSETNLNIRNKNNVVIPKIDSIQNTENEYPNRYNDTIVKPLLEVNSKENNNNALDVGCSQNYIREQSNFQDIHFSNYSNTLKNISTRLQEPHLLSFSEFKLMDIHPQQQRLSLYVLRKQEIRLQNDGIIKPLTKDEMKIKKKSKHSSSETFHLLQLAIHDNRITTASTLLNNLTYGSIKKKRSQEINQAFLYAITKKLENISLLFLNKGFPENVNSSIFDASLNIKKKQKKNNTLQFPSYFILAVALGLMDVVKFMIKKAIVNLSWFGLTPLILACSQNNLALVQLLLANGANPNLGIPLEQYNSLCELKIKFNDKNKEQWKLQCPIFKGSEFQRQWGENHFLPINKKYFRTTILYPIDIACMMNNLEIVRLLLTCMGVAKIPNDTLALKIHFNLETTILLLKAGAIPSKDPRGNTPLHIAARIGDEKLAVLYSRFFAIDSLGQNNWTPLHEAISRKNINICRYLISKGSSLDKRTSSGYTPLELAQKCGFTKEEINELYAPPGNPLDNLTIKEVEILDLLEANGIKILRPIHINLPLNAAINKKNGASSSESSTPNSSPKKRSPFNFFKGKKNNNNNNNNN
jgi:ankyrin repeat protein